jgi:hypothetical protein
MTSRGLINGNENKTRKFIQVQFQQQATTSSILGQIEHFF